MRAVESEGGGEATLAELIDRVREMPQRVTSLRVETHGWLDASVAALASERRRGLLVRRVASPNDAPKRRSEMHVRSWMECDEPAWDHPVVGVWPVRWREELEYTDHDGTMTRSTSARDRDVVWSCDDDGTAFRPAVNGAESLRCAWVVNRQWVDAVVERMIVHPASSVLGRAARLVRLTRRTPRMWAPGPFVVGDHHEIAVDAETGLTLAITAFHDDIAFEHHEVVQLELGADVAPELTALPTDAVDMRLIERPQSPAEVAAAVTGFPLLAPAWLPAGFAFRGGSTQAHDDGTARALLVFTDDNRRQLTIHERPDAPLSGAVYEFDSVERGARTVFISDTTDAPGVRLAHTAVAGTRATLECALPAGDLLEIALSMEVVSTT